MANRKKAKKKGTTYETPASVPMSVREAAVAMPERVRKNMDIDIGLLASARRVLGARTDTEAVNRALAEVSRGDEILAAMDALRDAGGLEDVFGRLKD